MLIKARIWIRDTFEQGSRPTLAKVTEWVENGSIQGEIVEGEVFVHANAFAKAPAREVQRRPSVDLLS